MASPIDSALYGRLFDSGDVGRLFSGSAEVRAMMLVEGALARVQGAAGLIPEISAAAIHRASLELQIDPGGLAAATGANGVPVPALVAAFRDLMQAPEHAQYLHWGATSQDIMDTALMLRLRQTLGHYDSALDAILADFARLARHHADTPALARTYGQHATPSSFGALVAGWGWPLLALRRDSAALRDLLWVSLSGAAGTASALGPDPAALRADLAGALGLADPGRGWHSDRTPVTRIAAWATQCAQALGRLGADLEALMQSDVAEVGLDGAGASSTMPQKRNPVGPAALVALARHAALLDATLQGAAVHRQARDGAAWFTEWLALPQLCLALASALGTARAAVAALRPDADRMAANLDAAGGLPMAEALSFALAARMPRPEAQEAVKTLCAALPPGARLAEAAMARWPDLPPDLFDPAAGMGAGPQEARRFAAAVTASG